MKNLFRAVSQTSSDSILVCANDEYHAKILADIFCKKHNLPADMTIMECRQSDLLRHYISDEIITQYNSDNTAIMVTPVGILRACSNGTSGEHPGLDIDIISGEREIPVVSVDYDASKNMIRTILYTNGDIIGER